jgi:hypothetical protein
VKRLGTGVDVFDYWVFLRFVEVGGAVEEAPDVGLAVAGLAGDDFGRAPAGGFEGGVGGLFEEGDAVVGGEAAEFGCGGEIGAGVAVGEGLEIGGDLGVVIGVGGGEAGEVGAVEIDAEEVAVVGVLALVHAAG